MNLLLSWKNSLGIFYPWSNFSSFVKAIFLKMKLAVPRFFMMFWWLFVVFLLADMYDPLGHGRLTGFLFFLGFSFIESLYKMGIFLSVSSISMGTLFDFKKNILFKVFLGLLIIFILSSNVIFLFNLMIYHFISARFLPIVSIVIGQLLFVWLFFFFASRGTFGNFFGSWKRAFLMILYEMPFFIFLFSLCGIFETFRSLLGYTAWVYGYTSYYVSLVLAFWELFIVASAWSVVYTKRLNE